MGKRLGSITQVILKLLTEISSIEHDAISGSLSASGAYKAEYRRTSGSGMTDVLLGFILQVNSESLLMCCRDFSDTLLHNTNRNVVDLCRKWRKQGVQNSFPVSSSFDQEWEATPVEPSSLYPLGHEQNQLQPFFFLPQLASQVPVLKTVVVVVVVSMAVRRPLSFPWCLRLKR